MRKFQRWIAVARSGPCYNLAVIPTKCEFMSQSFVSERLRSYLVPIVLLAGMACGFGAPPPTLQYQPPTVTPTEVHPDTPTPSIPTGATNNLPTDPAVNDLMNAVQSDRLMVTVGTLVDMHTRHVLSKTTKLTPGIAAARDWLVAQFTEMRDKYPQQSINVWQQQVKYTWSGFNVESQNVVATFGGTDIGAGATSGCA